VDTRTGHHMLLADYVRLGDAAAVNSFLQEIFARGGRDAAIREATCREQAVQDTRIVYSPIHIAAMRGDLQILRMLLATRADPNVQNDSGDTLLHVAASMGREEAVAELLQAGADPRLKNNFGRTAEDFAAPQPWDSPRTRYRKGKAKQSISCAAGRSCEEPKPELYK